MLQATWMGLYLSIQPNISRPIAEYTSKRCQKDEKRTAPIYNYARRLCWSLAVEHMYAAFHAASHRAANHIPVRPDIDWTKGTEDALDPANRRAGSCAHSIYFWGE